MTTAGLMFFVHVLDSELPFLQAVIYHIIVLNTYHVGHPSGFVELVQNWHSLPGADLKLLCKKEKKNSS